MNAELEQNIKKIMTDITIASYQYPDEKNCTLAIDTLKNIIIELYLEKDRADRNYEAAIFFKNEHERVSDILSVKEGKMSINQLREKLGLPSIESMNG